MFLICSAVWWLTGYPILRSLFDWVHLGVSPPLPHCPERGPHRLYPLPAASAADKARMEAIRKRFHAVFTPCDACGLRYDSVFQQQYGVRRFPVRVPVHTDLLRTMVSAAHRAISTLGLGTVPWRHAHHHRQLHHSRIVNAIAVSTLFVYLVHLYWPVTMWLQSVMGAVYRLVGPRSVENPRPPRGDAGTDLRSHHRHRSDSPQDLRRARPI